MEIDSFLNQIANMGHSKQSIYFGWMRDMYQEIKITKIIDLNLDKKSLKKIENSVILKACFDNSMRISKTLNIKYIQGYIKIHGIVIEHAWNKIGDKYFDATSQLWNHSKSDDGVYYAILETDYENIKNLDKMRDVMFQYWLKNIYKLNEMKNLLTFDEFILECTINK